MDNIKVIAKIKNNVTGIVTEFCQYWRKTEIEHIVFAWEEGNYSCDCNRGIFFDGVAECGEGKYLVNLYIEDKLELKEFEEN